MYTATAIKPTMRGNPSEAYLPHHVRETDETGSWELF